MDATFQKDLSSFFIHGFPFGPSSMARIRLLADPDDFDPFGSKHSDQGMGGW